MCIRDSHDIFLRTDIHYQNRQYGQHDKGADIIPLISHISHEAVDTKRYRVLGHVGDKVQGDLEIVPNAHEYDNDIRKYRRF